MKFYITNIKTDESSDYMTEREAHELANKRNAFESPARPWIVVESGPSGW